MATLPVTPRFDLCGEESGLSRSLRRDRTLRSEPARPETGARDRLTRVVEGEIIPKLMLAHRALSSGAFERDSRYDVLGPETIEQFAQLALSSTQDTLLAVVGNLLQRGTPMEAIYLDLLAPAARLLGEYWLEDLATFSDVTIALSRMQQIVHELSLHGPAVDGPGPHGRSALFAPSPGEQHTFGLSILEEFFRRSGWRTWMEPSGDPAEVIQAAMSHHFDVFGVSISCQDRLAELPGLIMSVRQASRNSDIVVLVGGRLLTERPRLAEEVGADGMTTDAKQAVLMAEGAVRQIARN